MAVKLLLETPLIWVLFFIYVYACTLGTGPVGAVFFYDDAIQERVFEMGLITPEPARRRAHIAMTTGAVALVALVALFYVLIVKANGATGFWQIARQSYLLFVLMELFDIVVIDTIWVALSGWWDIPGTEDLQDSYKDWQPRAEAKLLRIALGGIPLAALMGGLFTLVAQVL